MSQLLRHCGRLAKVVVARPTLATATSTTLIKPAALPLQVTREYAAAAGGKKMVKRDTPECTKPVVGCACARHPWEEPEDCFEEEEDELKYCDFNFFKPEVNPYDAPCECIDPPPSAGCGDVGRPKEVCCRSVRQYGCCVEESESSCEEDSEQEYFEDKTCDLDFMKLEVWPYDDPCECIESPHSATCDDVPRKEICCRTPKPHSCYCEAYDEPGLECVKEKAAEVKKTKKECNKKEWNSKCL